MTQALFRIAVVFFLAAAAAFLLAGLTDPVDDAEAVALLVMGSISILTMIVGVPVALIALLAGSN